MYHGHAPSYLCDLLPPLLCDVTNYPFRNRNDYTVPRCRLSLYQSSFIPSVINLWNSLDNDTTNTRTFDTNKINLKRKVVLAKIPAHFLVGDRRPNVLYARLRRNCSSLKYDLFRSNIITDSRCVCGYIREDAFHFLLNCRLYIEQRTILFNFLYHRNFRKDIGTLLFRDSQKDQAQNILLSNAVQTFIKNSMRFTEWISLSPSFLLICYRLIFQHHKCLYTYYPSCSLSDLFMYVWYWRENFIYKLWNLCSIPLYIFDNKICLNQRHVS
jgi:hypothetical protein